MSLPCSNEICLMCPHCANNNRANTIFPCDMSSPPWCSLRCYHQPFWHTGYAEEGSRVVSCKPSHVESTAANRQPETELAEGPELFCIAPFVLKPDNSGG